MNIQVITFEIKHVQYYVVLKAVIKVYICNQKHYIYIYIYIYL
jgi:hypothetical protein